VSSVGYAERPASAHADGAVSRGDGPRLPPLTPAWGQPVRANGAGARVRRRRRSEARAVGRSVPGAPSHGRTRTTRNLPGCPDAGQCRRPADGAGVPWVPVASSATPPRSAVTGRCGRRPFPDRMAFGVVPVEHPSAATPRTAGSSFRPRVERVLGTGVHALRAGGQMDVGGVAGDEDPADAVPVHQAVTDPEHRGPPQVRRGGGLRRQPVEHRLHMLRGARPPSRPCCTPSPAAPVHSSSGTTIETR
jgi:hypothetical protein